MAQLYSQRGRRPLALFLLKTEGMARLSDGTPYSIPLWLKRGRGVSIEGSVLGSGHCRISPLVQEMTGSCSSIYGMPSMMA